MNDISTQAGWRFSSFYLSYFLQWELGFQCQYENIAYMYFMAIFQLSKLSWLDPQNFKSNQTQIV